MTIVTAGINKGASGVSNASITQVVKFLPTTLPSQPSVMWNNGGLWSITAPAASDNSLTVLYGIN